MSKKSQRGRRIPDTERALIATVLADLGFTGTANFLVNPPTYPTLRAIAEEYGVDVPLGQRGRPAGSKNKTEAKRGPGRPKKAKRGRPVGSKNKPGHKAGRPAGSKNKPSKRGRRYDDAARAKLVTLIEEHGLTGTMRVLGDESPSIVTLHNIAKDAKVELTRGRPAKAA
tara:strand:- start:5341 stop:5850 length:510 start_codon:yes stop_codon:yes gene_type:complete